MRLWLSGPRMFGGFIRPGVSFSASELFRSRSFSGTGDFIYVIAGEHGLTKIGYSTNPITRLTTLQTASAHKLRIVASIPAGGHAFEIEQEAHAILRDQRTNGEWFAVSPNLAVAAVYGAADRLGITMTNEQQQTTTPNFRWPKSSIGQIFVVFILLWGFGTIIHALGWG